MSGQVLKFRPFSPSALGVTPPPPPPQTDLKQEAKAALAPLARQRADEVAETARLTTRFTVKASIDALDAATRKLTAFRDVGPWNVATLNPIIARIENIARGLEARPLHELADLAIERPVDAGPFRDLVVQLFKARASLTDDCELPSAIKKRLADLDPVLHRIGAAYQAFVPGALIEGANPHLIRESLGQPDLRVPESLVPKIPPGYVGVGGGSEFASTLESTSAAWAARRAYEGEAQNGEVGARLIHAGMRVIGEPLTIPPLDHRLGFGGNRLNDGLKTIDELERATPGDAGARVPELFRALPPGTAMIAFVALLRQQSDADAATMLDSLRASLRSKTPEWWYGG